jgi:orotate phosphoribosyltransferase
MIPGNEQALKVADFLLQIKAVQLNPEFPFTWASGLKSPIYCDNRKTLSYPVIRTYIQNQLSQLVRQHFAGTEVIAGVATGGIALGVLVANQLDLPFVYVRSESKNHGLSNLIEGYLENGRKVTVIEDLVSTGKSSLQAAEALKRAGAEVLGMLAVFSYGFTQAANNFALHNCPLLTLSGFETLIEQAVRLNYIPSHYLTTLMEWKSNPEDWSDRYIHSHSSPKL